MCCAFGVCFSFEIWLFMLFWFLGCVDFLIWSLVSLRLAGMVALVLLLFAPWGWIT